MKPLLLFVAICICLCAYAQPTTEDSLVQFYSRASADTNPSSPYFLIRLNQTSAKNALAKGSFSVVRKLSDNHCIVLLSKEQKKAFDFIAPANDNWKLAACPLANNKNPHLFEDSLLSFFVVVTQPEQFKFALDQQTIKATIKKQYPASHLIVLASTLKEVMQKIVPLSTVTFIDIANRIPAEEQALNDFDLSANKVNVVHSEYPLITGEGLVVSVKEKKPDTADIDFKGRFLSTAGSSGIVSTHATVMATIVAGAGNTFYTGKGVALGATISSSDFGFLLPDEEAYYLQNKITVQNHSYGTGIENYYGADALAYDMSATNNPSLLHVFSAGNSGKSIASTGSYAGIAGFANLTGSFKMAKNVLTVGSVDSFGVVPDLSSRGPSYDGRVKPDLVAFGQDGSSGAAAIVTGVSLLLQQACKEKNAGRLPGSALIRAVLLNSADDAGPKGIDFTSGYGNVNAHRALTTILNGRYLVGSVREGETRSFVLTVPPNAQNLKLTLAWIDPPATANAFTALVNDLDIVLQHSATGQKWQPWVLNSFAHADSLRLLPVRRRDSLNNAEQITLSNPLSGDYQIAVSGYAVKDTQGFYVAYQWDTLNSFKWTYPARSDNLLSGAASLIRWEANSAATAKLEFSDDEGSAWQTIDSAISLAKGFYTWNVPNVFATGLLRMTVNGRTLMSDTFSISGPVAAGVGFNCADSVLLYWNKISNSQYTLYRLGDKYLEPVATRGDFKAVIYKSGSPSLYYTVAPELSAGRRGAKSYTVNYTTQGVGCYLKSFLADLQSNQTIKLTVGLGTNYRVQKIELQRLTGSDGYKTFHSIEPVNDLDYYLTDTSLVKGTNRYRVKVVIENGSVIYSTQETVYNLSNSNYLVYPNPAGQDQTLTILANDFDKTLFQLFGIDGRKVAEKRLNNPLEKMSVSHCGKGVYFFVIVHNGVRVESGKLIIY